MKLTEVYVHCILYIVVIVNMNLILIVCVLAHIIMYISSFEKYVIHVKLVSFS